MRDLKTQQELMMRARETHRRGYERWATYLFGWELALLVPNSDRAQAVSLETDLMQYASSPIPKCLWAANLAGFQVVNHRR
ncbi:hypothetical protein GQ600_13078 [Phytophthora cactorum]|nr:hypothetical protein GQ600_13078 [Phytophthora cactorum]